MKTLNQKLFVSAIALLLAAPMTLTAGEPLATATQTPSTIDWQLQTEHDGGVVTVAGPDGVVMRLTFAAGENPSFSLGNVSEALSDGTYHYQMHAAPRLDAATRDALRRSRENGNSEAVERDLKRAGKLPAEPLVQSGSFSILSGAIVPNSLEEPGNKVGEPLPTPKDQVIPDDLIVQGSICAGFDCVNNENFGFDTIRLKENNLRIKFEDTSVGTFPTNDWQLTANDSASGGSSKFSIEDITGSRVPFTVTAGATTNSMFVDSTGRVGFRTSTPVLDLHVNTSNTPALRLEQNNSGGFTAQTWDVAGNEANFFVRDVTGGSRLSFRIRPGAPTSSLDISADGDVGIGTGSPSQKLEVSGGDVKVGRTTGGNTSFFLENTGGTASSSWILRANGTTGGFTFTEAGGNTSFRINTGALTNALTITNAGVDVLGQLRVNNTVMNVPDYVFEPTYELLPIEQQGEYMLTNKHLPAVGKAEYDDQGNAMIDIGRNQMGMLEELEKAHLYIQQLNGKIEAKDSRITELEARLARIEAALN